MSIVDSSTANESGASVGDTMTSSASADTKGVYDVAIAVTSEETYWVHLALKAIADDEVHLIDISVGGSGSEVVQIANIPFFGNNDSMIMLPPMPLTIANGARVTVRCQAEGSSVALQYMLFLSNDKTLGTSTTNLTMGADENTSTGAPIDADGVANTKGAYVQLDASTASNIDYFIVFLGNNNQNALTNIDFLVDVSTGAPTEIVQIGNLNFMASATELASRAMGFFHNIPVSTEVSVRCQASVITDAPDRVIDAVIIGFDITAPAGGSPSGVRNPLGGPVR